MTQVAADLDAIKQLRGALIDFAGRQREAMSRVESASYRVGSALDRAEQRAHRRIDAAWRELDYLHGLAAQGFAVNTYPARRELQRAEQRLAEVHALQREFGQHLSRYHSARSRFDRVLERDLASATAFLDRRIATLEAYHATAMVGIAVAVATAGLVGLMGGVAHLLRHGDGSLRRAMGSAGEEVAAILLSRRFGLKELPFTQPAHGFDRVFSAPGMPVIVVESKVSSSGALHLGETRHGQQGSSAWVQGAADQMTTPGSSQWSPANERIGRLVQEMGPENAPVLTVVTNPTSRRADVYVRQSGGEWRLMEGGISLDEITSEMEIDDGS